MYVCNPRPCGSDGTAFNFSLLAHSGINNSRVVSSDITTGNKDVMIIDHKMIRCKADY